MRKKSMALKFFCAVLVVLLVVGGIPAFATESVQLASSEEFSSIQTLAASGAEFDFSGTDDIDKYESYKKEQEGDLEYVNAPLYNSIDTVKNLPVDYARYGAFLREQGEIQRFSFYNTVKSLASPINRNVLTVYADQEVDFVLKNSQQVNIAESSGKYNSSAVSYYKRSTDGDKVVYFIELNLSDVGSSRHFVEFTTTSDTVQPHYSFWFGNPLTKEATATGGTFTINIFSPNRSSANVSVSAPSSVPQRSWVKSVTINRTSTYGDANINSAVLTITLDSGRALSGLRTSNSRITYGASLMYTNASPVKGSYKANLMSVSWKTGISASSRYSYSGKMTVNYLYAFGA